MQNRPNLLSGIQVPLWSQTKSTQKLANWVHHKTDKKIYQRLKKIIMFVLRDVSRLKTVSERPVNQAMDEPWLYHPKSRHRTKRTLLALEDLKSQVLQVLTYPCRCSRLPPWSPYPELTPSSSAWLCSDSPSRPCSAWRRRCPPPRSPPLAFPHSSGSLSNRFTDFRE